MSSSSSSTASEDLTLKLLINKTTNKVVYAETTKPVIDFLFHTLLLPISTALKHLNPTTTSLLNLYTSVQDFTPSLLQTPTTKQSLLTPKTPAPTTVPLWTLSPNNTIDPPISQGVVFYTCSDPTSKSHRTLTGGRSWPVSDVKGAAVCPHCGGPMTEKVDLRFVESLVPKVSEEGYVKPHVKYMITDDMVVKELTTKDVLKLLLDNPDVTEMGSLKERVVSLDKNQGMALLKASLISKTVLTDTFLTQTVVERSVSSAKSSKKLDKLTGSNKWKG